MAKTVVVAGTHSGVGKTSLSLALMVLLRQRGLIVQPFKVGPDFLDPLHHRAACGGRESINLDGWMLEGKQQVLDAFCRHTADADVAIVEGVMGLFDSRDGASEDGSTAQIAKWLGAPVVLVVDCWAMARSVAAIVKGMAEFDPDLQLCGVLLNKVGSAGHGVWLTQALTAAWEQQRLKKQVQVLGCIPKEDGVSVPERYLGLTMPHEQDGSQPAAGSTTADGQPVPLPPYLERLAQHVGTHVDLDLLLQLAATIGPAAGSPLQQAQRQEVSCQQLRAGCCGVNTLTKVPPQPCRCRIAVARDEAFCFYYQDNLSLLRAAGAELLFFSPLRSSQLPPDISGIYFGGGYPERHAQQLSSNSTLLSQVRSWALGGGVVYAECGGLIYLCQDFQPTSDQQPAAGSNRSSSGSSAAGSTSNGCSSSVSCGSGFAPLVGLLPFTARMGRMKMGYVEVEVLPGNPLWPAGSRPRGQVYHFSEVVPCSDTQQDSNSNSTSTTSNSGGSCGTAKEDDCGSRQQEWCDQVKQVANGTCGGDTAGAVQHTYKLQQVLPGAQPTLEGYSVGNVLASYVHLHWGGCPHLAVALVDKCCSSSSPAATGSSRPGQAAAPSTAQAADPVTPSQQCKGPGSGHVHSAPRPSSNSCCCTAALASSSSSKIVSLLPSGTEAVYALGLQDRLVGVSGFCDWPPEACSKARAVRSLIDVDSLSSDEIEAAMQAFKAAGQSPFEVDAALLAQQQPGLLLTQDACGTCDADCSLVCKAMQQAGLNPDTTQVLVLHPKTLSEVFHSIEAVGTAAGVADRAQQLVGQLQARLRAVAAAVQARSPAAAAQTVALASTAASDLPETLGQQQQNDAVQAGEDAAAARDPSVQQQQQQQQCAIPDVWHQQPQWAPRVLSLEGLNPLVLGGQWLPDVKLAAGAVDASGQQPGDPPTRITWEQVLSYAPDVLLLSPCSRSPAAAMPDVDRLTQLPGFMDLPAAASGRVYVCDHSLFSRPGPRLIESVELLHWLLWGDDTQQRRVLSAERHEGGDMGLHASGVLKMQHTHSGNIEWSPL